MSLMATSPIFALLEVEQANEKGAEEKVAAPGRLLPGHLTRPGAHLRPLELL